MNLPGREKPTSRRRLVDRAFVGVCLAATASSVLILLVLMVAIGRQGFEHLDVQFLTSFASRRAADSGFKAALWGSIWLLLVSAATALPLGVATAILLEEYKPKGRVIGWLHAFVQLNITNLAGVPSIVYGIIGLTVFVRMFGLFGSPNVSMYESALDLRTTGGERLEARLIEQTDERVVIEHWKRGRLELTPPEIASSTPIVIREHRFTLADGSIVRGRLLAANEGGVLVIAPPDGGSRELAVDDVVAHDTTRMLRVGTEEDWYHLRVPLGGSVLAGGLTLMLVILPIVIISSREAIRAVPDSLREGAFAAGATRWQMIRRMTLPAAIPGIMTGAILAMSRAIGEAAPILVVGGFLFITFTPSNLMSDFAAMPLQIFNWAGRPQAGFQEVAASGIIVLLCILLVFNAVAILVRQVLQKPLQ